MIKKGNSHWQSEFENFEHIVSSEVTRPLKPEQEKASFYLSMMKRAANFSVPGAGKTAMMYGTYAFLSSEAEQEVDRILIVCPLNAFAAWQTEYKEVFGSKRVLRFLNLRDKKYQDNVSLIAIDWLQANIIVINYESLQNKLSILNQLINQKTMLVFDEVHRVKGIGGKRAVTVLKLSRMPRYRYVMTGTPIPNGYQDMYNFLHLMYPNEYSSFFAWDASDLDHVSQEDANHKLTPFFWRTNKDDLHVPKPDPDKFVLVQPSAGQQALANAIYENENGVLARFIRLLQVSTNPELLKYNIDYKDLDLVEADSNSWNQDAARLRRENQSDTKSYKKYSLDQIASPKFDAGIQIVEKLASEGKKVLVWGMFVGTMHKIQHVLKEDGLSSILIYGGTPKDQRDGMINKFKNGQAQILISNPNTLGESISLHQTVHDAVYFEYNFNLTFMLQSRDRINRLGLPANQYTRYYYLMTKGDIVHNSFIDEAVYKKLKDKETVMLNAIEGNMLVPEYTDDYLHEVKDVVLGKYK